jgi:HPt (histidine-containing phosphotransfer) domain-containing protein
MNDRRILNDSTLTELLNVMPPEVLMDLVPMHDATVQTDVEALLRANAAQDVEEVRRTAHRIKSASLTLAAHQVAEAARFVEDYAKLGVLEDVPAAAQRILHALREYVREMNRRFGMQRPH